MYHIFFNLKNNSNSYLEALNTSRTNRIQDYKIMKDQVSLHVKDLIKNIHDEEQDLQKRIDGRIQYETEYIFLLHELV